MNKITSDCGAFCTLAVKVLIIIYVVYLGVKMASHDLDSVSVTEHRSDFLEQGIVSLS